MKRFSIRWVRTLAAVVLVASMLPVAPASAAVDAGGGGESGPPQKVARVSTQAHSDGVAVLFRDLPEDVASWDVYRSEVAGVEGLRLNSEPIQGRRFVDESALAGVQYYYTVKVASRKKAADDSRVVAPDVLAQVKADVIEAQRQPKVSAAGNPAKAAKGSTSPAKVAVAAPQRAVSAMATTIGSSGPTTIAVSTTWTKAKSPYFIRNDVVVASGKTLTIEPGVKVYFDTVVSGDDSDTPFAGVQSVTEGVDLIVHGKITANGTSTSPILFSSIRSYAASSSAGLPDAGDWGTIFVDSMSTSQISYAQVEYAEVGIWGHNTSRPYVKNCLFTENGAQGSWDMPYGAISFTQPKTSTTTPRIMITGNKIGTGYYGDGIAVHFNALGTSTTAREFNPYIYGNDITSRYPIEFYASEEPAGLTSGGQYGNLYVKGTVKNNKLTATGNTGYAVYIEATSNGSRSANVWTAFSGNRIFSAANEAVYVEASSEDTNGAAYAKPTFSGDKISATDEDAVYIWAEASKDSSVSAGVAQAAPKFTGCTVKSTGGSAVYVGSDSNGKGAASSPAVFSGGSFATQDDTCVEVLSESDWGSATASPSFTSVTGRSWYDGTEVVYCEAYAYDMGKASANPRWVGGSAWSAYDDGIYAYADSKKGSAEAKPYVSRAKIQAYEYAIDAEARASSSGTGAGTASCSGQVRNSTLISAYYDCYYGSADTNGSGWASASPTIYRSSLQAEDDNALDLSSDSMGGSSTCSPKITSSDLWAYDYTVECSADRAGSGVIWANATASPVITDSDIFSKYSDVVSLDADNDGAAGSAFCSPVVTESAITNSYDYNGFDLSADIEGTGTAEVAPLMEDVDVKSDEECVEMSAYGSGTKGAAKVRGKFTDCTFKSSWYDGVDGYAQQSNGGDALVDSKFYSCVVQSYDDYAYELETRVMGTDPGTSKCMPLISGGKIPYSADGIEVSAYADGAGNVPVTVAPQIKNVPIVSIWDYAIDTRAQSAGSGNASNNSYVYNCPSTSEDGIRHVARCSGGDSTGDAAVTARTLGKSTARMKVESYDYTGVRTEAHSTAGNASDKSETKYCTIMSADDAVISHAMCDSVATTATASPQVSYNVATADWGMDGSGISVDANAPSPGVAISAPYLYKNSITGAADDGISVDTNAGSVTSKPKVWSNTLTGIAANGIYVSESGTDVGSAPSIKRNTVRRTELCSLYVDGVPGGVVEANRFFDPGWNYESNDQYDTSNLFWRTPDPAKATVWGNMMVGARSAAVYYQDGAAKTNYNSFTDSTGKSNRPFNYWTNQSTVPVPKFDAKNNWWGTTSASTIGTMVYTPDYGTPSSDIVDYSSALPSRTAKVTSIGITKSATKVTFKVKFDRPMDTTIKTLKFGKSSPYTKYKVTGTWSADGKTFTGKRSRSGLPTGVKMYFSGAKDLPGNYMSSSSKSFKL